ncbi:MAG: condensation domain-containing protein, partial [Defluviitaleaceae bacterium]|nr:condensation domain-containing protein [Defluviitaleaceae bacterium]
ERHTGIRLGIKDIFYGVTIEGIAYALEGVEGRYEGIERAEEKEYYMISPSQKLYFSTAHLWDYNMVDMTNNIPMAFRVKGPFSHEKAEAAFEALMQRHEILRTSFHLINGETFMKVHDQVEMEMAYQERLGEEDMDAMARDFARPFDLRKAPLMRTRVVKIGDEDFVIFMDCHHIISDGVSSDLLLEEFFTLYMGGKLAETRLQYRDYSEWTLQRSLAEQESYWMNHFKDGVPKLKLPEDYPRPKERKFNGDVLTITLDKNLSDKVVNICKKMSMTPYMAWMSMAMILFSKYADDKGVVMGSPVSGRTHRDTEDMQGVFINRLLFSGKPDGEKMLVEFLNEVKENCLMAYENQDYPLTSLMQKFEPQAHLDKSRLPLYDIQFLLYEDDGGSMNEFEMAGLHVEVVEMKFVDKEAKFDLVCRFAERDGQYTLTLKYCTDLFKEETIKAMTDHFIQILERLDENLDQNIESLVCQK